MLLFRNIFDNIASHRGLFQGVELGQLNRLFNSRCYEEIECAFRKIYPVWNLVIQDLPVFLDEDTVQLVEGLAPGSSREDRNKIKSMMAAGYLFPEVSTYMFSHESLLIRISKDN
jgi:hypothetical protein